MPINYTEDALTKRRRMRKQSHGEELRWKAHWIGDGPERAELLERLRERQQRLKQVRERSSPYSRRDLTDVWRTAESRPQLYRHLLLNNLGKGKGMVVPQDDWAAKFSESPVERAKKLFIDVETDNGRVLRQDGSHGYDDDAGHTSDVHPNSSFKLTCNISGYWIKNNLRQSPSVENAKFTTTDNATPTTTTREGLVPGFVASSNKAEYIVDTGAGYHCRNRDDLTDEQRAQIKHHDEPILMNTANGPIRITEYIELQLLELGGARTLTLHVMEDSPNLLSTTMLCLEDGFSFWWDPSIDKKAHLINPEG